MSPRAGFSHLVIRASAGTGKTHAITRLYLRLLLEARWSGAETVERILVVTYTKAATAELRGRIRSAIVEALGAPVAQEEAPTRTTSQRSAL